MTDTEIVAAYQDTILTIAKKIAGSRRDRVDDLMQIGLLTLLQCHHKRANRGRFWAWASRAIANRMWDHVYADTAVVVSRRTQGRKPQIRAHIEPIETVETHLQAPQQQPADNQKMAELLAKIEADIERLPRRKREVAKKYLRKLEEGKALYMSRFVLAPLISKYRSEALQILTESQ